MQVTEWDLIGERTHFSGESAMDEVSNRITTLESFRKSASKADQTKKKQENCFWKRSGCEVRGQTGPIQLVPVQQKPIWMKSFPKTGKQLQSSTHLRALNQYLNTQHFKMESIYTLRDILKQRDYNMGKINLEDAYFNVKINPNHKKSLKFRWRRISYQYREP